MKKLIGFLLLVPLLASAGTVRTNVTLAWDYPSPNVYTITNGATVQAFTNTLVFKLYSSTNAALNTTNWPVIATIAGTNRTVTVPITSSVAFYFLTASNSSGESVFSNVAWREPNPSDPANVRLQ